MFENKTPTPLQKIDAEILKQKNISLYIKRDDLIHEKISGNKWRKLKYNLIKARKCKFDTLLTFGGAYSNHIAATAAAAYEYGFKSIGIIRGDELNASSNKTLIRASQNGMDLHFISREKYRQKEQQEFIQSLKKDFGNFYLIPEGGSNELAVKGCTEIISEIEEDFDYIVTAVGTGGTLAGITCALTSQQTAIGICVLKGAQYLDDEVRKLITSYSSGQKLNWRIIHQYHLGGYAKSNSTLDSFIQNFHQTHHIQLDPIYTGKMMMALFQMISEDYFKSGDKIIALHTGGLQGIQ